MELMNGVDIVDIYRMDRILEKNKHKFLTRFFTELEKDYISKKGYKSNTIAGIFAAKEAMSKALGTGIGKIGWKDIEILHSDRGAPYINLNKDIIREYNILDIQLSISHEDRYAIAFVIGQRRSKES